MRLSLWRLPAVPTRGALSLLSLLSLSLVGALPAQAQTAAPAPAPAARTLFVHVGATGDDSYGSTVGVALPWHWAQRLGSGALTGQWEATLGLLSARAHGASSRDHVGQLGAGVTLRWRAAQGSSPWFVEAGTGLVLHSRHYQSAHKYFSTRYNFASHLGLGRHFGPRGAHELAVRVQHQSNASLKKPNPGENFLLLRYGHRF